MTFAKQLGNRGEKIIKEYIVKRGGKVIASHYYCAHGEIDHVVLHKNRLIAVEVRTRKKEYLDGMLPIENWLSPYKLSKVYKALYSFVWKHSQYQSCCLAVIAYLVQIDSYNNFKITKLPSHFFSPT